MDFDEAQNDGFKAPDFKIIVTPNNPRPTAADVVIQKGPDGLSPESVVKMVMAQSTLPINEENIDFISDVILRTHKIWTVAAQNSLLGDNNSTARFVDEKLAGGETVAFLGVMSDVNPVWLKTEKSGSVFYFRNSGRGYESAQFPKLAAGASFYHILMSCEVRKSPEIGIKVTYPSWSDPRLSRPIRATIQE